jgi:hypothetical protein
VTRSQTLCATLAIAVALPGCAAKLAVKKGDDGNGIVYRAPETRVVVSRKSSYTAKGERDACLEETLHEFVALPLGQAYSVNVDNSKAWFASNQFAMKFSDAGTLTEVSLNSDPQVDETITATATLVKEVAAAAGTLAPLVAARDGKCGDYVEKEVLCMKSLDAWSAKPSCD